MFNPNKVEYFKKDILQAKKDKYLEILKNSDEYHLIRSVEEVYNCKLEDYIINYKDGFGAFVEKIKSERKRSDNIKRAQDKIFDIAFANDFTHFITFTLDSKKINRYDPSQIIKKLNIWLDNQVRRNNLVYLLVPEYHKDGAIHFHGLCKGDLKMQDSGTVTATGIKKPVKIATALKKGFTKDQLKIVYNCENWGFGYSTAVELDKSKAGICKYIIKYITKDTNKIFGRFYLSGGKGLLRDVETVYLNSIYSDFEGTEIKVIENFLSVKYKTLYSLENNND